MRAFVVAVVMIFTLCVALLGLWELRRGDSSGQVLAIGAGLMFAVGLAISVC